MNNPSIQRDTTGYLTGQPTATADNSINAVKKAADSALDGIAQAASGLRADVAPMIRQAADQASDLAHRGADAVRHSAQNLRDTADAATARTRDYIKDEPVKAVLIAAATGAALMALFSLVSHSRNRY